MKVMVFLCAVFLTGACQTSPLWYETHPDKQDVNVDGHSVSVVPRGGQLYDAFGGAEGLSTSMPTLRARQIYAIENVTGCKVKSADYMPGTYVLQASVECRKN